MNYIDQLNQADSESSEPDTPSLSTHSSYRPLSQQSSTVADEDRDGQQEEEDQSEAPKINFMPSEGPQSLINISACEFNEF